MTVIDRKQSRKEEELNGFSHLIGILFCLIAMPLLLQKADLKSNWIEFYALLIFGLGILLVYTFSTAYHLAKNEKLKYRLQIADHISIYFLIAGTYTPVIFKYLELDTAMLFLAIMWTIVLAGSIFKCYFTNKFERLSVLFYIVLGWMLLFVLKPLLLSIPIEIFYWILAGGLSYMIGVYFYIKGHKMYYHLIWHIFVLFGTILHFMAIWQSVE
jgi:hemolysin III